MTTIDFQVQGSAPDPYTVTFELHGTKLSAYCTCPAGENGQYCKHRFAILGGNTSGVVSGNVGEVTTVASWLVGSNVQTAMNALAAAEAELAVAQTAVSAAKKKVAAAMR